MGSRLAIHLSTGLVIRRVRRHMPRAVNNIAKAQAFGLAWRPAHTVVDAAASPPSP